MDEAVGTLASGPGGQLLGPEGAEGRQDVGTCEAPHSAKYYSSGYSLSKAGWWVSSLPLLTTLWDSSPVQRAGMLNPQILWLPLDCMSFLLPAS